MFASLKELVKSELERTLKEALRPVGPYLRKLGVGSIVLSSSIISFGFVLLFLFVALFLHLAEYGNLSTAALWTAGTAFLWGTLAAVIGASLLRPPR